METLVLVVTVIVALLLGIVVLIQNPKGGGLGAGFQGAAQVGGVQRTADFLEKATWYLGIGLFVLCLGAAMMNKSTVEEPVEPTATEQPAE
jgi:preprotein translocase subunit SecG